MRLALALCALAVPALGQSQVWLVSERSGPGVDFQEIQRHGGAGIDARAAALELVDCQVRGGPAGVPFGNCAQAFDGPKFALVASTLLEHGEPHRALVGPSPLREAERAVLELSAPAGDLAWLILAGTPGHGSLPTVVGPALFAPPFASLALGPVPAGDATALPFTVPELGAGVEGRRLVLQGLFASPGGGVFLGQPSDLLLLDASL